MKLLLPIIFLGCLTGGCGSTPTDSEAPPIQIGVVDERPSVELGLSAFAAMHPDFPCERWLEPYRRAVAAGARFVPVMSFLWGTFNDDSADGADACVRRFVAEFGDKPHILQIHFSNEAGRRNERLKVGEFQPHWDVAEYNRALESGTADGAISYRLNRILEFLARVAGPKTEVIISRGLEDNFTDPADVAFAKIYHSITPIDLVANPVNGRIANGDLHETHGLNSAVPHPCIANEDGNFDQSIDDSRSFAATYRSCTILFWLGTLQGLGTNESWVPPRDRIFQISDGDIQRYTQLFIESSML